nr:hypothetical protein SHINE37_80139 [Rhizobiaceae bacterium]
MSLEAGRTLGGGSGLVSGGSNGTHPQDHEQSHRGQKHQPGCRHEGQPHDRSLVLTLVNLYVRHRPFLQTE